MENLTGQVLGLVHSGLSFLFLLHLFLLTSICPLSVALAFLCHFHVFFFSACFNLLFLLTDQSYFLLSGKPPFLLLHLFSLVIFLHLYVFTDAPLVSDSLSYSSSSFPLLLALLTVSFLSQSLCLRSRLTRRGRWTQERWRRGQRRGVFWQ